MTLWMKGYGKQAEQTFAIISKTLFSQIHVV